MILEDLKLCLQLAMGSLEQEQLGNIGAALHGLEDSLTQISYVQACSNELGSHASLVNAVCSGLIFTISNRAQVMRESRQSQHSSQHPSADHIQREDCYAASQSELQCSESVEIIKSCSRKVTGSLSDVSGLLQVKEELRQAVIWPLRMPHLFCGYRKPPKTFLLVGPPGCGKTMIVEKIAAESGSNLLSVSPSNILSKWSGESERTLRALFATAANIQPCIVFLDEVDALAGQRSSSDDPSSRRLLTELLIQMTRAAEVENVLIMACTNRIQDVDTALLRRFERRIFIPLPDPSSRSSYFQTALARPELIDHALTAADLESLVTRTEGYSCSDLLCVVKHAAMIPLREAMNLPLTSSMGNEIQEKGDDGFVPLIRGITLADLIQAVEIVATPAQDQGMMGL